MFSYFSWNFIQKLKLCHSFAIFSDTFLFNFNCHNIGIIESVQAYYSVFCYTTFLYEANMRPFVPLRHAANSQQFQNNEQQGKHDSRKHTNKSEV